MTGAGDPSATAVAGEQRRRDLVVDLAHEMRGPVTVLQATFEALADGVLTFSPGAVASLSGEVARLSRLLDDLQQVAAAGSGLLPLDLARCDLAACAAAAADGMSGQFRAAGIRLHRRLSPVIVRADARRLQQVIGNLLGNSAKFTPPGGDVLLKVAEQHGTAVVLVEDTGPGIAPEDLPRVFERRWRGRRAADVAGSGIGLAVVATLVRAHGGEVRVSSRAGGGSRLTVTLPLAPTGPGSADLPRGLHTISTPP